MTKLSAMLWIEAVILIVCYAVVGVAIRMDIAPLFWTALILEILDIVAIIITTFLMIWE